MSSILIMDQGIRGRLYPSDPAQELEYRRPDDSRSFWTGTFRTVGKVRGFLCGDCGRIALYGEVSDS
jgi:hypothetical protein